MPRNKRIDTCAADSSRSPRTCTGPTSRCAKRIRRRNGSDHPGQRPQPIGQGIEFDYAAVCRLRLPREGFETVMVTATRKPFNRLRHLRSPLFRAADLRRRDGNHRAPSARRTRVSCVVQFGGQTPLKLAWRSGGRRADSGHVARTRSTSRKIAGGSRSCSGTWCVPAAGERTHRRHAREARESADKIGYPVVLRRPTCWAAAGWRSSSIPAAGSLHDGAVDVSHDRPVLIDRFLEDAFEFASTRSPTPPARSYRRHHGAHRGSRYSFRRQLLRVPPFMVADAPPHHHPRLHPRIARALKVVGT